MLDPIKVKLAVDSGLAFVCAMCTKWWKAQEKTPGTCESMNNGSKCGGPIVGQAFPLYEGPLTNWTGFCFRCGNPDTVAGIRAGSNVRMLATCKRCLHTIERLVCEETGESPNIEHHEAKLVNP